MAHSVLQLAEADGHAAESVVRGRSPAHQGRLVLAPGREFDGPVLAHHLVGRVTVQVLLLGHVDARNFRAVLLAVPWGHVARCGSRAPNVVLGTLVGADLLRVQVGEHEFVERHADAFSLDGTVAKLSGVRGVAGRRGPD
jgi:hypothetical protein